MKKTTFVAVFAILLIGLSTSAFATTVLGTANIYGAVTLVGAGDGSGTAPTLVSLAGGTTSVDFTGVSGVVDCTSGTTGFCGTGNSADGGTTETTGTAITAPGNGISGITFSGRDMFLVGVFINSGSAPSTGAGPAALNYGISGSTTGGMQDASDVPSFEPALNQVFFIGDGTEGLNGVCPAGTVDSVACVGGTVQISYVPTGANELFLGFVDGAGDVGSPGDYNDNTGSITLTVNQFSGVPEPGTMMLMGLGLAACALLRKKLA